MICLNTHNLILNPLSNKETYHKSRRILYSRVVQREEEPGQPRTSPSVETHRYLPISKEQLFVRKNILDRTGHYFHLIITGS